MFLRRIFHRKKNAWSLFLEFYLVDNNVIGFYNYMLHNVIVSALTLYLRSVILKKHLSFCLRKRTTFVKFNVFYKIWRIIYVFNLAQRSEFFTFHCVIDKMLAKMYRGYVPIRMNFDFIMQLFLLYEKIWIIALFSMLQSIFAMRDQEFQFMNEGWLGNFFRVLMWVFYKEKKYAC